jgi:hypothetical protein
MWLVLSMPSFIVVALYDGQIIRRAFSRLHPGYILMPIILIILLIATKLCKNRRRKELFMDKDYILYIEDECETRIKISDIDYIEFFPGISVGKYTKLVVPAHVELYKQSVQLARIDYPSTLFLYDLKRYAPKAKFKFFGLLVNVVFAIILFFIFFILCKLG